MSTRAAIGIVVVAGGLLATGPAMAQDAAERQALEREVAEALRGYHAVFSGKDSEAMADRGYAAPLMSLGNGSHVVWTTRASICILTPTSAIASGEFIRYRADGSVLSRHGNAYVFSKGDDGWRVAAMLSHDAARPLTCD